MRKLRILVMAIISFVTFSASAQIGIGGTVGLTLPMGDFGNGLNTGFGFNVMGKYNLSENMAVGASVGYSSFGTDVDGYSFGVVPITALLEYSFASGPFKPYFGSDLGLYMFRSKFTILGRSSSSTDTYFGLAPTAGVLYDINDNLSLCGNLKYNVTFTKDALDQNQTSTWLGINAGIIYKLGK